MRVGVAAIGHAFLPLDAGPKAAVGEAVVGFGAVERLSELALGDVADEAEVASAGLQETVTIDEAQGCAIPGAAQQGGELGAASAHRVEDGGELLGEQEQTALERRRALVRLPAGQALASPGVRPPRSGRKVDLAAGRAC